MTRATITVSRKEKRNCPIDAKNEDTFSLASNCGSGVVSYICLGNNLIEYTVKVYD